MLEYRTCSIRASQIEDRIIRGTAALYEVWQRVAVAEPLATDQRTTEQRAWSGSSGMREKVAEGAVRLERIEAEHGYWAGERARARIKALVNHSNEQYLGNTGSGALKLQNKDQQLQFELTVPETQLGNDVLAMMRAEGELGVSIGFVARGRKSNIKRINFRDNELESKLGQSQRASVVTVTPMDSTDLPVQEGVLDGSDYVEGIGIDNNNRVSGRNWRVYKSFAVTEVSLLVGKAPAWEGTTATQTRSADELSLARMQLELMCLGG